MLKELRNHFLKCLQEDLSKELRRKLLLLELQFNESLQTLYTYPFILVLFCQNN